MRRQNGRKTGGDGLNTRNATKKKWVAQKKSHEVVRAVCEAMEDRVMLNASLKASIPALIQTGPLPLTLLAPGNISFSESNGSTTAATSQGYRFVVNNTTAGELTSFSTVEPINGTPTDSAIALYDAGGNLLTVQDADASGNLANETLNTALANNTQYEVVYYERKLTTTATQAITLNINPTPQGIGSAVTLNPSFGTGTLTTSSATDSFVSPRSVRYFPINFLDGGTSGSIQISAAGPDSSVNATLYSLAGTAFQTLGATPTWQPVASGSTTVGGSTTLTVTPPIGADVTDGNYVLAVAPNGFTAAAEPVTINISASNLLSPIATNPATVVGAIPQTLTSVGIVGGTVSGSIAASTAKLYSVTATLTGNMTVSYQPNAYNPLLAVYGPSGTSLIDVKSSTSAGSSATSTFAVVAGQTYYLSAGVDAQTGINNTFTLTTSQQYVTTPIAVTSTLGQTTGLNLAQAAGASFFQLTPTGGSGYVALQIAPTAGLTVQATVISLTQGPVTTTASGAGQPLTVIINESGNSGPYDVELSSTSGTGTATFKYVALTVPQQLSIGQLPTQTYNLVTGGVSVAAANVATGSLTGAQYYIPPSSGAPTTNSVYTATANNGAAAIVLHYVQVGSVLKLAESAATGVGGTASVSNPATTQALHAVAGLAVNFSGTGTVGVGVTGPLPTGIGLGFVPNALPTDNKPVGFNYQSSINLQGVGLTSAPQIDLYSTTLPANMTSTSADITFSPVDVGGPLNVTFSVLNSGNAVIASGNNTAGQPLTITLTGLAPNEVLRFEVTSVPGTNLGSGKYTVGLTVTTTDPRPYLVTQGSFLPFTSPPAAQKNYFPSGLVPTVLNYNTTDTGNFTSSTPYNPSNGTGSIQVFQIPQGSIPYRQPFQVTITDVDPTVNANFALFYQDPNSTATPNPYIPLPGTSVNFDYYPGDRSQVDARIIDVNLDNTPAKLLGEFSFATVAVYAVVMNEQGSLGHYNISATAAPTPATAGPGTGVAPAIIPFAPSVNAADLISQKVQQTVNNQPFSIRMPVDTQYNTATNVTNVSPQLLIAGGANGAAYTVSVQTVPSNPIQAPQTVVTANGTFNSAGTALVTLANTSGAIQFLNRGTQYTVKVFTSSFPSSGLTLGNLTVTRTTVGPLANASPTSFPLDAGLNTAIPHADPSPDGKWASSIFFRTGQTTGSVSFSVAVAGAVSVHLNYPAGAVNTTLGLYQSGQHNNAASPNFNFSTDGVLLDSQNATDANGQYTINAFLLPGTYFLTGSSSTAEPFTTVSFSGTIPAAPSTVLALNPTTGSNTVAEETTNNQLSFSSGGNASGDTPFYDIRYNNTFYTFTAPANVSGAPLSVFLADTPSNIGTPVNSGIGNANVVIWRLSNGVYTRIDTNGTAALRDSGVAPFQDGFVVTTNDVPTPGAVYYVGLDMNGFELPTYFGVTVPIITTGLGDYSVQPISLTADSGKTLVTSSILNSSYTGSPASTYTLQTGSVTSNRLLFPLAPFGVYPVSFDWTPGALSDVVSINADPTNTVAELSETNNFQSVALNTVDHTVPSVTIRITDTAMTAEGTATATAGGGTWGRYIAGVTGQTTTVEVTASDNLGFKLYQVRLVGPPNNFGPASIFNAQTFTTATDNATLDANIDFGQLNPTTTSNPNNISFSAIDQFGLSAPAQLQHLDVIAPPSFLTGGVPTAGNAGAGGNVKFDHTTHKFTYAFQDAIINYASTVDGLLNSDLPVIGQEPVSLLVAINANGTGGLSPTEGVPLTVAGQLTISAINQKLLDKSYSATDVGDHFTFNAQMILSGATLLPGSTSVSLQLSKLSLFNISTPLIPIFSLGIPDVASVDIGLKYSLSASLSAGVKLGTNPGDLSSPSDYLASLGVMSPTFIEPSITGKATVSGQVEVAGFHIASLSGSVGLTLSLVLGLDNSDPDKIFKPVDALHSLAFDVDATLNVSMAASLPIIGNIWSYNYNEDLGNIVNTTQHGIFLTDPPSTATGKFIHPGDAPSATPAVQDPGIVPVSGSSLDSGYVVDPSPQLVIDNSGTGKAISVQLVNTGTGPAPIANLSFATRTGGSWTGAATLTEGNDVTDPQLALSHDGVGNAVPAVVAYDVDKVAGSPTGQTINNRLDNEEIAYRYYNGSAWSNETALTSDSLYDSQPHIAFNSAGAGMLAYVHNTAATPMNTGGVFSENSNDLQVSTWNATTHTFGAPVAIGTPNDGVSDSSPSAFVDAGGNKYLVWIRGTGNTNQLFYSTSPNGSSSWSVPAQLSMAGLPAGGNFNNVALGSDGTGRVDVVFSYSVTGADGSVSTTLFDRISTTANFTATTPLIQLSSNSNYSGLRTATAPTGAMVVYWQQSDGQMNQIFEATVLNGSESGPFQASDNANLATSPSLAVDSSGKLQVLYDNKVLYGGTAQTQTINDPAVGTPLAAGVMSTSVDPTLPQLTFLTGLSFPTLSGGVAPTGSILTGSATIANRGQVGVTVTVTGYNGIPGQGGTAISTPAKTYSLAAGASLVVTQDFTVLSGVNTYSLQLTSTGSQAFDTVETISSTTLTGGLDLAAVQLTDDSVPTPGSTTSFQAIYKNRSTVPTGPFTITLYQGDPLKNQNPLNLKVVGTQTISSIAGSTQTSFFFNNIPVPATATDDVFTVYIDSADNIAETNETNNYARYEVDFRGDPTIATNVLTGVSGVTATQLNTGNSNNVNVSVNVADLAGTTLTNVPIDLQYSHNGGPLVSLGQVILATLNPGDNQTANFTVTALAGDDVFVASIDSAAFAQDINPSNNIGSAELQVQGLPTLGATLALSRSSSIAGSALSLTATVNNTGLADGTSVPLTVLASLASGGPSVVIGTGTATVAGLSSSAVVITLNTAGLAPGLYTITLQIDPNHTVLQGSDAGNVATTTEIILAPNVNTITGTAAIDGITLIQDPDHTHIDWTLNGASGGQLSIADATGLTINGNGLNDTVFLDYTNGNPLPNKLNFNGIFTVNNLAATGNPLAGTTLDLKTSTVFITYAGPTADPITLIKGYLKTGFNGGAWTGTSTATTGAIRSSSAAGTPLRNSVGYADSADVANPAGLLPNTIELRYTVIGDANLDGIVGLTDLTTLLQNYNTGSKWDQGDINYDGGVGLTDLTTLLQLYNQSAASPGALPSETPAAVPVSSAAPTPAASTKIAADSTNSVTLSASSPPTDSTLKKAAKLKAKKHK